MPVSHGVNKKACPIVSHHPTPLPGFHPVCLLFYKKYFIKHFFSDRIIAKNNAFSDQKKFFFKLIADQFWFCCFVYMCFLGHFFTVVLS